MNTNRPSLLATMRRANLSLVVTAISGAWLALTLVAYVNLRIYVNQNLQLVANSIAYAVQAATYFHDAASAQETITLIGSKEELVTAEVFDALGTRLASFESQPSGRVDASLRAIGDLLFPQLAATAVQLNEQVVGRVAIRGNSLVYVTFFGSALAAVFVCLGLVVLAVARLSRRLEREVVEPLNHLASLTHAVRLSRSFGRRAAPATVKEIHQLGEDFNALLAEIERHEAEQQTRAKHLLSANESLSHQATHDSLTGLPNRLHFRERLAQELAAHAAIGNRVGVLYVDNDNFKAVNDRYGHAAGDALLIESGRRIRSVLRGTDIVARVGGDEFAVLLSPLRSVEDAGVVASNIVRVMREPVVVSAGIEVVSSVSVGVAVVPDHAETLDELLVAADAAMYQAKSEERNTYRVAPPVNDSNLRQPNPLNPGRTEYEA